MDKTQLNKYLAVIITSIAEHKEAVSGHVYAAMMNHVDIHEYNMMIAILIQTDIITRDASHILTITPKGLDLAAKITAITEANNAV